MDAATKSQIVLNVQKTAFHQTQYRKHEVEETHRQELTVTHRAPTEIHWRVEHFGFLKQIKPIIGGQNEIIVRIKIIFKKM